MKETGETVQCVCVPGGGCDEEGDPGCAYCRSLDGEWPCPGDEICIVCGRDLDCHDHDQAMKCAQQLGRKP